MMEKDKMPAEQPVVMRMREVCEMIDLKSPAIDRMIRRGMFPRPFLIGVKAKGFDRAAVMAWMEERRAARDSYADPARPNSIAA